jgi:polar amino acid transport system substrate-binding protein
MAVASRVLLLLFLLPGWCLGQAAPPTLPIGVAEFPPFKYSAPNGRVIGSDTEIVQQVFERMGYRLQIQMQPWKRVQAAGEAGQFAAIYSLTKSAERERHYYFSDPINTVQDVLFKTKNLSFDWKSYDDLSSMRIAVSAGYNYAPEFAEAIRQKKITEIFETSNRNPETINLRNLTRGLVDLTICEINVCRYLIRSHVPEFDDLEYLAKPIGPVRTFHVAFSRKWPNAEQLSQQFNVELAKFVAEGGRKKIFEKYRLISNLP